MIKRVLLIRMNALIRVKTPHPYAYKFPFMLKYMEALLKKAGIYQARLLDCQINPLSLDRLLEVTLGYLPDMVVLFSTTPDYSLVLEYAEAFRKKAKPVIICVGQDITFRPDKYIFPKSPIDIGILGEAEFDLIQVISKLNSGTSPMEIRTLYLNKGIITVQDLDNLLFPIYNKGDMGQYGHVYPIDANKKIRWGHILSSRGCPYNCIFCSQTIRESYGKKVRLRSPANIVDEMQYLHKNGADIITFDDDNFTTARDHIVGVCNEIQQRGFKTMWIAHARVDNVTTELLKIMKQAGCVLLRFGVESGSERIVKILKKTKDDNWVGISKKAFKACRKAGISTAALFLIGNPTETKQEVYESMCLSQELSPDIIQVSFFTPYPGAEAYKQFENKIADIDIACVYHYSDPVVNLSAIDSAELKKLHKAFYKSFFLNPKFMFRHFLKYSSFYFHNPGVFLRLLKIGNYLVKRT